MDEVKYIEGIVAQEFAIYDVKIDRDMVHFYVSPIGDLDSAFDAVRRVLVPQDYVPFLLKRNGHLVIAVAKKAHITPRSVMVNLVMFVLTVISTMAAGAMLWYDYIARPVLTESDIFSYSGEIWGNPGNWLYGGLFFALPLLTILGIHEMGHYLMSKKHGVAASLPFFMPAPPPFFILGTFGAFISMREPMPDKKALVEIGAAGPIAGFVVALPVTIIGLILTNSYGVTMDNVAGDTLVIGLPPIFYLLMGIVPVASNLSLHPTAFAGWVGLFVTFINLLPAGQLDGGHVARAILGDNARYLSYGVVIFLFFTGLMLGVGTWIMFALLIMILGLRHPPPLNEISGLDMKQKLIAGFAAFMFIACFVPQPFSVIYIEPHVHSVTMDLPAVVYGPENGTAYIPVTLDNTGNEIEGLEITVGVLAYNSSSLDCMNATAMGLASEYPHFNWEYLYSAGDGNATIQTTPLRLDRDTRMMLKHPINVSGGLVYAVMVTLSGENITEEVQYTGLVSNGFTVKDRYTISTSGGFGVASIPLPGNVTAHFTPVGNISVRPIVDPLQPFTEDNGTLWYGIASDNGTYSLVLLASGGLDGDVHVIISDTDDELDSMVASDFASHCAYFTLEISGGDEG